MSSHQMFIRKEVHLDVVARLVDIVAVFGGKSVDFFIRFIEVL